MPLRTLSGRELGQFGDLGGVIEIEFVPPPEEIARDFLRVAGYLENTLVPLTASRAIARQDMQKHFDQETAPDGTPWFPLDTEYAARKERKGQPPDILHATGTLENAATSEEAWLVTEDAVVFNTGTLPVAEDGSPYWYFHQTGTGSEFAGAAGEYRANVRYQRELGLLEGVGGEHESFGIGRGKALPARPFIGLSEEAELAIIETFDAWFDEGVDVFVRSGGFLQMRTPSGRFGPVVGSGL